jgi:hypothetical protein
LDRPPKPGAMAALAGSLIARGHAGAVGEAQEINI